MFHGIQTYQFNVITSKSVCKNNCLSIYHINSADRGRSIIRVTLTLDLKMAGVESDEHFFEGTEKLLEVWFESTDLFIYY
jgi:hypothetical protein